MNFLKRFLVLIGVLIGYFVSAQNFKVEEPVRYLALGDSYTIGASVVYDNRWPSQLYDSLGSLGYELDTLSYIAQSGWRTDDLSNNISQQKPDSNYNLVSLLIGVNNQFQGRDFIQYENEFPALLNWAIVLAGGEKSRVFVVSIPDYMYTPFGSSYTNPEITSSELDTYNAYAKKVSDSIGVRFYNITPISRKGIEDPDLVSIDALHPSGKQYKEWVKLILETPITNIDEIENDKHDLTIFPNPTSGEIQISNDAIGYEVLNLKGELLLNGEGSNVDLSPFSSGTYLVRVLFNDGVSKLLKVSKE